MPGQRPGGLHGLVTRQTRTALLAQALGVATARLAVAVRDTVCLVDNTLVTVFTWRHRDELYSGKHRRYGITLQGMADVHGRLVGISRPLPGRWPTRTAWPRPG